MKVRESVGSVDRQGRRPPCRAKLTTAAPCLLERVSSTAVSAAVLRMPSL